MISINKSYFPAAASVIVFIFIFSIYNDNFIVDYLGTNSLKIIFLVFLISNTAVLHRNLIDRDFIKAALPFFLFCAVLILIMIFNPPRGGIIGEKSAANLLLIFSMIVIVGFFSLYDFTKSLYFIWTALLISSVIAYFNEPITQWTFRKTGGTGDPNEFASQMISFMLISVYLYLKNKNIYFLIISSIAFLYSVLSAASMSSFIAIGVLLLLILLRFLSLSLKRNLIIASVLIFVTAAGFYALRHNIKEFEAIDNVLSRTENLRTADTRIRNLKAGVKMIIDKPLTGIGMGEYASNSREYSRNRLRKDSIAPHNMYVHVFAESGVFAFTAFAYFLYTLLTKSFLRIIRSDYFWIYLSLVGYLLMGFTLGITYTKFLWLSFALLICVHLRKGTVKTAVKKEKPVSA